MRITLNTDHGFLLLFVFRSESKRHVQAQLFPLKWINKNFEHLLA